MRKQPLCYLFDYNIVEMLKFGDWLRSRRKELDLLQSEVAKRAGVSTSYISTLERSQPHSITGADLTPDRDKVIAIAKAVQGNPDEALVMCGYAPKHAMLKPTNLAELIQALEDLGLPVPMLADGWEGLIKDDDGFEEALDRIKFDLEMVIRRVEKGRKRLTFEQGAPITLSDVDLDDLEHPKARKLG